MEHGEIELVGVHRDNEILEIWKDHHDILKHLESACIDKYIEYFWVDKANSILDSKDSTSDLELSWDASVLCEHHGQQSVPDHCGFLITWMCWQWLRCVPWPFNTFLDWGHKLSRATSESTWWFLWLKKMWLAWTKKNQNQDEKLINIPNIIDFGWKTFPTIPFSSLVLIATNWSVFVEYCGGWSWLPAGSGQDCWQEIISALCPLIVWRDGQAGQCVCHSSQRKCSLKIGCRDTRPAEGFPLDWDQKHGRLGLDNKKN